MTLWFGGLRGAGAVGVHLYCIIDFLFFGVVWNGFQEQESFGMILQTLSLSFPFLFMSSNLSFFAIWFCIISS